MIAPLALSLLLAFQAPPPAPTPTATGDIAPSSAPAPKQRVTFFEKSEVPLAADVFCKIDGFPVTRAELGDWLQRYRGDQFIQHYVTGTLIRKAAKAAGVEIGPEDLEAILNQRIEERTVQAYRGNRDYFIQQEITQFGKTLEQWKAEQSWDVETEVLVRKTMKKKRLTTDADVEKEFKRLYGASGRELWLRAVLIEVDMPTLQTHKPAAEVQLIADQAIQKAYRKGVDVVKRLQSGAIDFPSAALAYSDDGRSKNKGGDIGRYIIDPPEFGPEFDAAIQKAKLGQIVGPIRIQAGFIVAEITKEQTHDLRKERDAIRKELGDRDPTVDEANAFIADLIFAAKLVR